jgi:hypothetical protein
MMTRGDRKSVPHVILAALQKWQWSGKGGCAIIGPFI